MIYDAFMSYSHAADGKLAPRVQSALHRLAKPLFRLRALHVFRDQTSLSATPALWSSIEEALNQSEYFILMASPEAAASPWVQREVEHWLTKSPPAREGKAIAHFLIVLTEGDIQWDKLAGDFDWNHTNALPARLRRIFSEEPLYVDMRGVRTEEDLSLQNPEFRGKVADLAAPLHSRSKEELIGEDVRILRRNRRLGWSISILLALLATVASITAYVAIVQRNAARSRELAAKATVNLEIDPRESLRYAMEAVEVSPTEEAASALREALVQCSVRAVLKSRLGSVTTATFSPDGARILAEVRSPDGRPALQLWEVLAGNPLCFIKDAQRGTFTADGLQVRANDGRIYDALTCQAQAESRGVEASSGQDTGKSAIEAAYPAFPDSTNTVFRNSTGTLELAYQGETPVVRDAKPGNVIRVLRGSLDPIGGAAFSEEDGTSGFVVTWPRKGIYTESGGGPTEIGEKVARVWGVKYEDMDRVLAGHRRAINMATLGPENEIVVTGSDDRTARVWLRNTGDEFAVLRGHEGAVDRVAVSPDGSRILTLSEDGTVRIWEPGTTRPRKMGMREIFALQYGLPLPDLQDKGLPVEAPMLSVDHGTLMAKVDGSRINIWEARTGRLRCSLSDDEYGELRGSISPDGSRVVTTTGWASVSAGGEVARIWDVQSCRVISELGGHAGPVYGAAYSPDGLHIVTVGEDGMARLWNATTFHLVREWRVSDGRVLHAAFSADSARLLTASRDSLARIWYVGSGRLLLALFGHQGGVVKAVFSPDDKLVVSVGEDETRIWDSQTGKMLGRYMGSGEQATPFITPDCGKLVTGVYGEPELRRVHTFGACGTVDQLLSVAKTRVTQNLYPESARSN